MWFALYFCQTLHSITFKVTKFKWGDSNFFSHFQLEYWFCTINCFDPLQKAQESLKYYKGYKGKTDSEINMFSIEFERLKSIAREQKEDEKFHVTDFSKISRVYSSLKWSFV